MSIEVGVNEYPVFYDGEQIGTVFANSRDQAEELARHDFWVEEPE